MVKEIPLTQGKVALVDDEDYEYLNQWNWGYSKKDGYAVRWQGPQKGPRKCIYMHRQIVNPISGFFTDHINGDRLNNTRLNLRVVTKRQNQCNSKIRKNNSSGFKGVRYDKGRWRAQISIYGVTTYIGTFSTAEAAARAYDKKALDTQGEYARLNFA